MSVRRTGRPLQQPEPIRESVAHLDRAHGRHARRRQLDAEGEPVEVRADLGHRSRLSPLRAIRSRGGRRGRGSTNSVTAWETGPPSRVRGTTANGVSPSTARGSREVATTVTVVGPTEDRGDGRARRGQDVFAIVDDEEEPASSQRVGHRVDERRTALRRDPQHGGDRGRDGRGVADRCQLDQPHPVDELAGDLGAHFERQPGLADTADAGQRHEPVRTGEVRRRRRPPVRDRPVSSTAAGGCRRTGRRCGAPGTRWRDRRRRPGTRRSAPAARGGDARPEVAGPPGRAAAPRSRRRRGPDRRVRATSAVLHGSRRCRSSSGRVGSPHQCEAPCAPRGRHRCRHAVAPGTSIAAAAASAAVENAAPNPSPPVANT